MRIAGENQVGRKLAPMSGEKNGDRYPSAS